MSEGYHGWSGLT